MASVGDVLTKLWMECGLDDKVPLHRLSVSAKGKNFCVSASGVGLDCIVPSSFRVASAATIAISAAALAAAEVRALRRSAAASVPPETFRQNVSVDARAAVLEFRSERHAMLVGKPPEPLWDPLAGAYQCRDGRWVRVHTNFQHHKDRLLTVLGCAADADREAVAQAFLEMDAFDVEERAAEAGAIVAVARRPNEWVHHEQGHAAAALPTIILDPLGEPASGDELALPPLTDNAQQPLEGIRVLDLTRIIAGPVAGRDLAYYGAEVLRITSPNLPHVPAAVLDVGRGKRSAHLDLTREEDRKKLRALVREADVVIQAYRPGAIAALGFGPDECAAIKPGIIYCSLSAYSHVGPWAGRRGFDSIVQTSSGMNLAEAEAAGDEKLTPKVLPAQAIDHGSGHLLALAVMAGLMRRGAEKTGFHVRLSLLQTANWIRHLGIVEDGMDMDEDPALAEPELEESPSGYDGMILRHVPHAAKLEDTPAVHRHPSVPLGTDPPTFGQQ